MNQILYKGEIFGGVGEDVTNRYDNTKIIYNPVSGNNETINLNNGDNSEIFNSYSGEDQNMACGDYSTAIGKKNLSINGSYNFIGGYSNTSLFNNNSLIIGCNNFIKTNSSSTIMCIGNNLIYNRTEDTNNYRLLLGVYNKIPNNISESLVILGNGDSSTRSNCLIINNDGSQEITLKDKNILGTLGIGRIKIEQEGITIESLKNNTNDQKESFQLSFEEIKQLKNNLDNISFPIDNN